MAETNTKHKKAQHGRKGSLFGGLKMTWGTVIAFAVATAVLTAVFLTVPVFEGTSFERMGVHLEAWIFFAVIIMSNCRKPLESALKTFVFFLISQPLIYLIQVPFSYLGWGIFRFYRFWGIMTVLTFPAAFAGWFITKKNWLSVLILAPVLAFLGMTLYECADHCVQHFPYLLISALFCLMQIILYIAAFFPKAWQKAAGVLIVIAALTFSLLTDRKGGTDAAVFLPDGVSLSENAVIRTEDPEEGEVLIEATGENSRVRIRVERFGEIPFEIDDEGTIYRYIARVYRDDQGHTQIEIRKADE